MSGIFVIGNGLSVAVRPDLALTQLTAAFLAAIPGADAGLLEQLNGGPIGAELEAALAGVETLRESLHAIRTIHEHGASPVLDTISATIAGTDLVSRLER